MTRSKYQNGKQPKLQIDITRKQRAALCEFKTFFVANAYSNANALANFVKTNALE